MDLDEHDDNVIDKRKGREREREALSLGQSLSNRLLPINYSPYVPV